MRILRVTLGFLPAVGWGGPVQGVYQTSLELQRRGHRVTVYCMNLLDKAHRIRPHTFTDTVDGIEVVYFDTWNLKQWPGTLGPTWLPEMPARLADEIARFDVVHIHGYRSPMFLPVARAARRAGAPFIVQPHGAMSVVAKNQRIKRLYDRWVGQQEIRGLSALIALQESERQQALRLGVPAEKIHIIPNGLDPSARAAFPPPGSFRARYGLPADRPLILFLGRINLKKGTDMLVEAFAQMRTTDALLVIAGPDDGQLAEVQALVKKHHLEDRVLFTGLLSGAEVYGAHQDADVFVLPCRADTFPRVIVEACLAETPMVVTDRCEIADVIDGHIATITPFAAGPFAEAVDDLLEDPALYARYRANCRLMMQDTFSLSAAVDRLEALYQAVAAEAQPGDNRGAG